MRLKSFLLLTVAALPIAIAGCANSASEVRALYGDTSWTAEKLTSSPYDRAKEHFAAGRFGLAVKQFELALSENPKSIETLNGLAASFDQLQRYEVAERYYLRALNLDPKNTQTLNNMGYSYLMQGRYDLAVTYLKDAVALDPKSDMARENLQQAQASFELENRDFMASAVGSAEFRDVMAAPRTVTLRTQKVAEAAPSRRDDSSSVQIEALAEPDDLWVERSSAAVQTLITQPNPDLLLAMREAGLTPRIANFRNQSAVTALQTQPAPWQTANQMVADAMVERQLTGAIRRDRLVDDSGDRPVAAPTVAVDMAALPRLSAPFIEDASASTLADLPRLSAAFIDSGSPADARTASDAAVPTAEESADGGFGDLPQLSAAVIGAAGAPADRHVPPAETRKLVIRPEAAVSYEAVGARSDPAGRKESPALPPVGDESPVIEVSNGTGRAQMALRVSQFLDSEGLNVMRLTNAEHFSHQETVIFYRREWQWKAQELAAHLPVEVGLEAAPEQESDIRIRLGGDLLNFDQGLFYASRESSAKPTG